ncbi:unnamed protein product [Caenorhabditis auriculariae]|uniref:Peptidase M3A/M3B catalytic domain-containing protein n=1 Tax=Caenorhabditis auriculariae TaxID=2777116 RepID=A0A8S1HC41_9PELO|nr:unnamed protein product [Caenorhabditis auriculariae]
MLARSQAAARLRPFLRTFFGGRSKEIATKDTGLFNEAKLKSPADILALPKEVRKATSGLLAELTTEGSKDKPGRTALQIVDDISNEICKAADLTECVRQLHDDKEFRNASEIASRDFCDLVESLNTDTSLYGRLKSSETTDATRLDEVDKRTLTLFLDDFEQSGVHLSQEEREKFVNISGEIFDACARFQSKCDSEVVVKKPDQVRFSLPSRIYSPVSHSSERNKREFVYNAYYAHNEEQENQLRRIVGSRHSLAQLTGFESFAHRAQRNSLLKNYESVRQFLWGIIDNCRKASEKELAVLTDIQTQCQTQNSDEDASTSSVSVAEWDLPFLMHLYRESAFNIAKQTREIAPFFTISTVLNGFSKLAERLYGIRLVQREIRSGELWKADSLIKLEAIDEQNNDLGTIYLDVSIRPEKAHSDCHYTVRCSKLLSDGRWQSPIVVLALSLQEPLARIPWQRVPVRLHSAETMFHELGHAMHSILGRTRYQHVAGTRCPQDFSEIPSNLMEYFFSDLHVLRDIMRSSDSSASLSVDSTATVLASRCSFTAIETVQQAAYGLYDLELHGPEMAPLIASGRLTTTELFHSIMKKSLPYLERNPTAAFHHRFHHTVQYGAKYYSYLVAKAAASLIWQQRFRDDPFSRRWGECWAEVQSHGGGHPPGVLLEKILGFEPTADDLTAALSVESKHLSNLDAVTV